MPEARELHLGESHRAAIALLELRPRLESIERITSQIDAQRSTGYRVVASFEDGDEDAAAVAGFRVSHNLAWGRFLYVDDLVTRAVLRGRGHAEAVMGWVDREARRQGCGELHLDSGVGPERQDAHRFYFRHGMRIASYHFSRALTVER
jgi:GNAT superfamily N-acetyltransferase